ncbi:MAG: UDP-N-acetylglucosamine 2-epimerase (non-hydrolyzing) [Clostridiaceae bacterium]|jgi:UDP-N-acetylglucosamine 2-epimerase|nr:UDP-N-acetylglucosamine 2-epimerase (non-hydrolyzing) [Clostridiaceae bacterium]
MSKIKMMTVFGTRPEAIKMAPLVKELAKKDVIESLVCVTAQHRQMLDQVLDIFKIKPDYDLNIMQDRQTLIDITARAIEGLYEVFQNTKPDMVLVHGDTTTTFAASLAAFYAKVKVGHVEAGLRTYDKYSPYPEEMNRKLTGAIADLHFAPTIANKENLLKENVDEKSIFVTGNTVIDALSSTVLSEYKFSDPFLNGYNFDENRVILVTAHRRENIGQPLNDICTALRKLCDDIPDISVIYPVHLNPVVRETANRILGEHERIHLIDPLNVQDMHNLMNKSTLIMTDSGGLQEEAPSLGKPVLVLRNETERPEAVKAGTVKLLGTDSEIVYKEARLLLEDSSEYQRMAKAVNPYGDGKASKRITEALMYYFKLSDKKPDDFFAR